MSKMNIETIRISSFVTAQQADKSATLVGGGKYDTFMHNCTAQAGCSNMCTRYC